MKKPVATRVRFRYSVAVASVLSIAVSQAFAADAIDLGTVGTSATGAALNQSATGAAASRAAAAAPTQTTLEATQPKSIINRSFIEESRSPVGDYSTIAVIAPSVTLGISPNGPGLGETKNGLRGFKDGEFNITFDGIPFGDTNGPTHHSTAYFPAAVIGRVEIERGPGQASNFGAATFGGTIGLFSRDLARERTFAPTFSYGSWNTKLMGARYDSGTLQNYGDAALAINAQQITSDGYRTYSKIQGQNLMLKFEKPVGDRSLITANLNINHNWYQQNDNEKGITLAQAQALGKNYALGIDPTKANYFGYNKATKSTAMNYVRFQSDLGSGWGIDNNAYYYNYTNNTLTTTATDLTTGTGSVKIANGATVTGQMPGGTKNNEYAVWGDIFKTSRKTESGLVRFGAWVEKNFTHRAFYDYNLFNNQPNYDQAAVPGVNASINNVKYEQKSGWTQYQPFIEYEWNVTPALKVTPGLKYMHWNLTIDASVNQTARIPQNISKDFSATLPFLAANYRISPVWSTYMQYAKGMLVPDISSYQSSNADASSVSPQTSTNYQWGVVHQSDKIAFDADLYYIDFDNKIATVPGSSSSQPVFYNQGGVVYKGVEAQLTYAFGNGISLYANGSLNRAASKASGLQIAGVPDNTTAVGVLYKSGPWSGSLVQKRVGSTYVLDDQGYPLAAYSSADFSVAYRFTNLGWGAKNVKLQLNVFNLFNHEDIIAVSAVNKTAGSAAYGQPNAGDTFSWQPPRSMMATFLAEF